MAKINQILLAVILATACAAPIKTSNENVNMGNQNTQTETQLAIESDLPSFAGATGWLNSPPLTGKELRGKVIVVEFWTYTCINWLRTEPYVRAWAEKYKDNGLVVIGVHTPEFPFEQDVDNVRKAARDMKIDYPIAIDSNNGVWNAFNNHYWPALYFIDAKGHIRHHQFGEGEYEQSEKVIQQLLAEAGSAGVGKDLVTVNGQGPEAAPDWDNLRSAENYVGYDRTESFAASGATVRDKPGVYSVPTKLNLNQWGLSGEWTRAKNNITLNKANGRISYRFHARDLHLVMGPQTRGSVVRFRVLIDGQPPRSAHGADIDDEGNGVVTDQRLYQLIRQRAPITDRLFEIEFLDPGVEAFVFTFG